MSVTYATRELIKASLEINHTSRSDPLIDSKNEGGARSVEDICHRRFYPELKTVKFDYPNYQYAPVWRLWLGDNELISVNTLTSGGVTITGADYMLRRSDGKQEPPYTHLELDLDSSAAFGGGSTHQEDIQIYGLYGYRNDSRIGGELAAGINDSVTTVDINPVSGFLGVGVGSIILVGTERMNVIDRRMLDTTVNLASNVDNLKGTVTIPVSDGSIFAINEIILIDAERMLIVDIAGNNLIVKRAFDGSVLAAHTSPADVYAQRRYTVERGVLGTTAAAHSSGDDTTLFVPPGLVQELNTAIAVVTLEQNAAAYARTIGSEAREASGGGLHELEQRTYTAHGRKGRVGAI